MAVLPEPEPQAEEIGPTVAAPVEEPASEPEPQPEPEPEEEIVEDEPMAEEPGQKTAGGQGKTKNKLLIPIIAGVAAVAAVAALVLFGGKKADTPAETEKAHISQNQQVEDLDYNLQREPVIYANSTVVQEFQDYSYLEITTDENGNEISRLYYDGDRNLIRRDEASYDAEGRMVSMAGYDEGDNLRISREWEYNAAGKVAKLTTRLDGKDFSTVVPEYDSHGEKIHWVETAADGTVLGEITYEYEYDAKGTKLSSRQTYFDGSTWDITYDIRGNAVTEIYRNWAGEETRYERVFNEYGEVIENTAYDADGNMTFRSEYSWDNRGRNTKCVTYTPDGEVDYRNGYVYDAHGNEYAGSYEAQGFHETWQTVYDIAGYPIRSFSTYRQSNYQSEGIDYYDYLGNVETSESYSEGALNYKAEYQYDAYGRELGHTGTSYNPYDGTYTVYVYDADGNETETKMYDGNGAVIANIEREYDENGHETRYVERRPDGTIAYEYTSRYSADGIEEYFMSIQYTDTGAVEYRSETWYDSQGREIKNIYENQDGYYHCYETQYDGNVTTKTGYDRDGNVEYRSETWYDSQGREIKNIYENQDGYYHCYETQYDGNVTTKTGYDRDGNVESLRVTTYDSTGRAMSETYEDYDDDYRYHYEYQYQGDVTITISYDENGNEEYRSSEQHTENGLILKYYYDDANRMKRFYVYDRNWEDLLHIYADAETMAGYQPILNAILKMDADMVKTMADDLEALTWYASEFTAEEMEVLLAEIMASYGYDYVRFFGYDPFAKLEESAGAQPEETQPTTPAEPTGSLMQAFPLSDGDGDGSSAPAFGLSIQREDVTALFFTGSDVNPMDLFAGMHGNVEGMTMNSQDISEALDGSVMAHEMGGVIVICGNGGVAAPENCDYLFSGFRSLETVDFGAFHTAGVKSMHAMFAYCKSLVDLDLSGFNTSQVTDMSCMFYRCNRLKSVNVSSFDTSRVADMNAMFATGQDFALGGGSLSALERLDLSNFNTANVTNMSNMFHNCDSLRILNVSSFDTAKVTDMSYMFNGCKKLSSLDLSSFNTSRVTNMSYMLFDCTWTNVDHFDFSKVTQYENFMNYNYEQYFE